MSRSGWATAALVLLAAGCTGAKPAAVPSQSPTRSAVPHTQLSQVRPVTASGHLAPGYRITRQLRGGDCHDGSEAFGHGYRCFVGNEVLDPCWRSATPAPTLAVLCLQDPYSHVVTALTTAALEPLTGTPEPFGGSYPWGIRLSDGKTCIAEQGAHDTYNGRPVDYSCPQGQLAVLRGLHQARPLWTADTVHYRAGDTYYTAGPTLTITSARYGRS
jgi:hypothetical protein